MNEQRPAELSSLGIQSSNLLIITKEALLVRGSMSKLGCRYRQYPLTQPNILGAQGSGYRPTTQGQHREQEDQTDCGELISPHRAARPDTPD